MALLEVHDLVKLYGRSKILDKVSFTLGKGIHGLIGPNGAGKTTTLKVLLGLTNANAGNVRIFGLDVPKESERVLERVGVLHENPRLPSWATGRQFLRYVASLKHASSAEEILNAARTADIDYALDKSIGVYSAGMTQRIGFAAALIGNPELIFLDEPTANLDPLGRIDIWNRVKELQDEKGVNFVISTHALFELEKVCQDVVILHQGTVLDQGTIEELTARYSALEYRVRVDNSTLLISDFSKSKTVQTAEAQDGEVVVSVRNPEVFFRELSRFIQETKSNLTDIKSCRFTLEDIFVEAFRRKLKE